MPLLSVLDDYIDDIADTDSASYTDAKKHASMTRWAHTLTEEVVDAQDDWDFQGEISTADLVANQREYTFPTDILKIKRIDLCLDGTNWTPTIFLDESQVPDSGASETDITEKFNNSNPYITFYDKSFFILSGTITNVTDGIKIWYSEEIVGTDNAGADITAFSADTDSPNLNAFAQMGLVYGAVLDFADKYENESLVRRMNLRLYGNIYGRQEDSVGGLIGQIRDFYSRRIADKKVGITTGSSLENFE